MHYLNWSSGKDAAFALYTLQNEGIAVKKLVTTINTETERVSMHGLSKKLLIKQAEAIGIPLKLIELHGEVSMETYNDTMSKAVTQLKDGGFETSVFGDIFLEDLRAYREEQLKTLEMQAHFPLWNLNTKALAQDIIDKGFKAIVICTNNSKLPVSFCGREYDRSFLEDLPDSVDPCGEHGEFHTFIYDGPIFKHPVRFSLGDISTHTYKQSENGTDCHKEEITWDVGFSFAELIAN